MPQKGVLFSGDHRIQPQIRRRRTPADEAMKQAAEIAQATELHRGEGRGLSQPYRPGRHQRFGRAEAAAVHCRGLLPKSHAVYIFDDSFLGPGFQNRRRAAQGAGRDRRATPPSSIVAQRISTILHAEQIIVLDEGKVAGIGTHERTAANLPGISADRRSQLSCQEGGSWRAMSEKVPLVACAAAWRHGGPGGRDGAAAKRPRILREP